MDIRYLLMSGEGLQDVANVAGSEATQQLVVRAVCTAAQEAGNSDCSVPWITSDGPRSKERSWHDDGPFKQSCGGMK